MKIILCLIKKNFYSNSNFSSINVEIEDFSSLFCLIFYKILKNIEQFQNTNFFNFSIFFKILSNIKQY